MSNLDFWYLVSMSGVAVALAAVPFFLFIPQRFVPYLAGFCIWITLFMAVVGVIGMTMS